MSHLEVLSLVNTAIKGREHCTKDSIKIDSLVIAEGKKDGVGAK